MDKFIPGFRTAGEARRAGRKTYGRANGFPGVEGRDFHLEERGYGREGIRRWFVEDGKGPVAPSPAQREGR